MTSTPRHGVKIEFHGGDEAFFLFTPAGSSKSHQREMQDSQGRTWLLSGHRSLILKKKGGFHNVIEVNTP